MIFYGHNISYTVFQAQKVRCYGNSTNQNYEETLGSQYLNITDT